MKIVGLIATWRGEHLLAECVASIAPHVDRVIVLDGAYGGIPGVQEISSTDEELNEAALAGGDVYRLGPGARYWRGEIEKRNVLLELGRAFVPEDEEGGRWALVIDEDEVLVNGFLLSPWLAARAHGLTPGLERREPDGQVWAAPSRLFRLTDTVRYSGRSYWLDYGLGDVFSLEHMRTAPGIAPLPSGPFVEHRWDQRSQWRRDAQWRYGRHLAELDHGAPA